MPRCLILLATLAISTLSAAVLPEQLGTFKRGPVTTVELKNPQLWQEYGLELGENAVYRDGSKSYNFTLFHFKDPTGAYAGLQQLEGQQPGWKQIGNYVYRITGDEPKESSLRNTIATFPNLDVSATPTLDTYLPSQGLVKGSHRYILGPISLEQFEPQIKPSEVAFSLNAEGQAAVYRIAGKETKLLLLSYPTPQIARRKATDLQTRGDLVTKRAGPLVAILVNPADHDEAERFLSKIRYESAVTINEPRNRPKDGNAGDMLLSILIIAGVLILLSMLLGMAFGGFRVIRERFGLKTADNSYTTLDIRGE
ncbi:MAG TPA: hypothetical protein VE621_23870 [Bryobacteraceae bacterium]|nr:hypothetical protein [Bryobacteraceae bacterium]